MFMTTNIFINLIFVTFQTFSGISAQMNKATANCIEEIYGNFNVEKTDRDSISTFSLAMKAFKELVPKNVTAKKNTKKYHDHIKTHIRALPIEMEVLETPKKHCQKLADIRSTYPEMTRRDVIATEIAQKLHLYSRCCDEINFLFENNTSKIEDILEYAYDNLVEDEISIYQENNYGRIYYTYMIKFVDFNVEFIQSPSDFCLNKYKDKKDSNESSTSGNNSASCEDSQPDTKAKESRFRKQLTIGSQSQSKRRKGTGSSKDTTKKAKK